MVIQPGLERIGLLLKNVDFGWKAIHVAGTNGKGSVCNYAHNMLIYHGIPCARFTSPHLVDRWDCIHINNKPVSEDVFKKVEKHFKQLNEKENIQASEFEVLTATAFQLFNDHEVDIGVVEVGMGGKLDATNILNNQCVSVITKIAYDHQNFLGNTLDAITRHKAGILRPGIPYVVNPANEMNVRFTVDDVATEIGAGPRLDINEEFRLVDSEWKTATKGLHVFQRENAALATLAVREAIGSIGRPTFGLLRELLPGLKGKEFPGRYQRLSVPAVFGESAKKILTDGAHNDDAARTLKEYVDEEFRYRPVKDGDRSEKPPREGWPVTWVMAMSEGKDPRKVLQELLQPQDNLVATTFGPVDGMPWVKCMDPNRILEAARAVTPAAVGVTVTEQSPHRALTAAKYLAPNNYGPVVLTGSLYLMGDFWRERRALQNGTSTLNMEMMDKQEQHRINRFLSLKLGSGFEGVKLQRAMQRVEEEIKQMDLSTSDSSAPSTSPTATTQATTTSEEKDKPAFRIRRHFVQAQHPLRYQKSDDVSPWDSVLDDNDSSKKPAKETHDFAAIPKEKKEKETSPFKVTKHFVQAQLPTRYKKETTRDLPKQSKQDADLVRKVFSSGDESGA